MNRLMFFTSKFLPLLLISFGAIASASGQVSLSPDPPAACSSLAENLTGAIGSRIFDEMANANHGRGQVFEVTAGPSDITAITIRQAADQTFANDTITLIVFEGAEADWTAGTGHTTAADGTNYLADANVTELSREVFTLNGLHAGDDYITFTLATPVSVDSGDFGFLMIYTQVDGTETNLFYDENQAPAGETNGRIALTTTGHAGFSSRGFRYAVLTTPTSAGLGDVNQDFIVNFLDIAPFITELAGGGTSCEADVNQDGSVDFLDIAPFIGLLASQ